MLLYKSLKMFLLGVDNIDYTYKKMVILSFLWARKKSQIDFLYNAPSHIPTHLLFKHKIRN